MITVESLSSIPSAFVSSIIVVTDLEPTEIVAPFTAANAAASLNSAFVSAVVLFNVFGSFEYHPASVPLFPVPVASAAIASYHCR